MILKFTQVQRSSYDLFSGGLTWPSSDKRTRIKSHPDSHTARSIVYIINLDFLHEQGSCPKHSCFARLETGKQEISPGFLRIRSRPPPNPSSVGCSILCQTSRQTASQRESPPSLSRFWTGDSPSSHRLIF